MFVNDWYRALWLKITGILSVFIEQHKKDAHYKPTFAEQVFEVAWRNFHYTECNLPYGWCIHELNVA